jgi:hypothetical protein
MKCNSTPTLGINRVVFKRNGVHFNWYSCLRHSVETLALHELNVGKFLRHQSHIIPGDSMFIAAALII